MRQHQRDNRMELEQEVEEISPTGAKRTLMQSGSREVSTEKRKVMNPFAD